MKQVGMVVLISVAASAAPPAPHRGHRTVTLETSKTVEQFSGCFINAQDRASQAWAYIPQSRGGTFSNFGARGARVPYFLAVLDRGSTRQLRLETTIAGSTIDTSMVEAVGQCV